MDEILIPGRDDGRDIQKTFFNQYDVPAYVRRANEVEQAENRLLGHCRAKREEWLKMVRMRLGLLRALAGEWQTLLPWLADEGQLPILETLYTELQPRLRARVDVTGSKRILCRGLRELQVSLERFNRRWAQFVQEVDFTTVNELRDGYNRYYVLEKECAMRSPRLAALGFRRLEPMTADELAIRMPLLPTPRLKE